GGSGPEPWSTTGGLDQAVRPGRTPRSTPYHQPGRTTSQAGLVQVLPAQVVPVRVPPVRVAQTVAQAGLVQTVVGFLGVTEQGQLRDRGERPGDRPVAAELLQQLPDLGAGAGAGQFATLPLVFSGQPDQVP